MRARIDAEVVSEYQELLASLPPVVVFDDGDAVWLADGFHRLAAYECAGRSKVPCEVRSGTLDDAILFAAGANADHGLRRTNADKRRAVEALLSRKEWAAKSDRWVAKAARVSDHTVASVRGQLRKSAVGDGAPDTPGAATPPEPPTRTGQDGKARKPPTRKAPRTEAAAPQPETERAGDRDPLAWLDEIKEIVSANKASLSDLLALGDWLRKEIVRRQRGVT